MNLHRLLALPLVGGALVISACATPHDRMLSGGHDSMDITRMCAMHRQMMAGKSPAEQQAAIEAHVKSMHGSADPQMMAMHRQRMDRHCAGTGTAPNAK